MEDEKRKLKFRLNEGTPASTILPFTFYLLHLT
jgi:hypothetical protein